MNIIYVIDEGPRVYIERINIVGNFRTEDQVIRRQFRLAEGDAFNRLLVEAARKRLRALGFFKTVEVETKPGQRPDRVVIMVKVVEQPTGELSFGAGYSTSEGIIGDVSITERNLMGKGQYVRLGFSGSFERAQVDLSFTEPYFLDRNLAAGFDLFHKEVDFDAMLPRSSSATPAAIFAWAFRSPTTRRLGLRYRFEQEDIFDVRTMPPLPSSSPRASRTCRAWATPSPTTREICRNSPQAAFSSRSRRTLAGVGGDVNYFRSVVDAVATIPSRRRSLWSGARRAAPSRAGAARTSA